MAPVAPLLSRYGHGSEDTTCTLPVEINGQTNRAVIVRTVVARGQAVVTLRDVLAKLDVDPRYNSDVVRARIAAMFFPVLNMVRRQWYFKVTGKFVPMAHSRRQCAMDGPSTLELLQVVMRLPMIKAACSLQEQRAILACFLHILKHTDFRYDHSSTVHTMHARREAYSYGCFNLKNRRLSTAAGWWSGYAKPAKSSPHCWTPWRCPSRCSR